MRRSKPETRGHGSARLGCLFTALLALTAAGLGLLARAPQLALVLAVGIALMIALTASFVFTLRRVSAHFRAQDRLRRQLMADVAHELRTPLAILQGRIEGVLDGVYPRDDRQLAELLDETRHLSRLVDDLGTLANAEAGALELRKEMVDLGALVRDAAASFDDPIVVIITPDLPEVNDDPVRIRQVILNLLSNAVQHTPADGTVTISATANTIEVTDTDPGIPAEDLLHIFDRFYKTPSRASGLGLAIARNLVLAHGWTIEATSRVGEGTRVRVGVG